MQKASLPIVLWLIVVAATAAIGQQQAPQQPAAPQPRTHSVVMREIANTRGGSHQTRSSPGTARRLCNSATRLEGLYKEFVVFYEQMKLEPGLSIAKEGLIAASEGVAAVKAKNFEAAAAMRRMISRVVATATRYTAKSAERMTYLPHGSRSTGASNEKAQSDCCSLIRRSCLCAESADSPSLPPALARRLLTAQ